MLQRLRGGAVNPRLVGPRAMRGFAPIALLGALSGGCSDAFTQGDAHHPGTPLGTFHVEATLTSSTCGANALGSQTAWAFDVKLARDATHVFWDNGREVIQGSLAADGRSFVFESAVEVDMRAGGSAKGLPPCTIHRSDDAAGELGATEPVDSFEGTLRYGFSPTDGSRCDDLVSGPTAVVLALPCAIDYALQAKRTGS